MQAAVVGAGVIGCGWAARFLLHGWDVRVYDKAADTEQRIEGTLARARPSLFALYDGLLPTEGTLSYVLSPEDAVAGADWVQESLPETLAQKQAVYRDICSALPSATPLASSTSGFKPTDLAVDLDCASQLVVCHPFNPVYLLPAVEVVKGRQTDQQIIQRSIEILRSVGMYPVPIDTEIDAHVADRLMEALWREALWLVKDGVATTQQIDDVMRFGFGLRWAQMGLFETYRLGGGDAGMRHFLAQFGPALSWPWSRLTDVPDLDAALIEKIASQSDAQSGHASINELADIRDRNLVAILRALQQTDSGAGALVNEYLAATRQ
jgi:carnitine 3-dehydrogenase / betainyl-CoA thioesterase